MDKPIRSKRVAASFVEVSMKPTESERHIELMRQIGVELVSRRTAKEVEIVAYRIPYGVGFGIVES